MHPRSPLLFAALLTLMLAVAGTRATATEEAWLKIHVDSPGIYALDLVQTAGVNGERQVSTSALSLTHRGDVLPSWRLEADGAEDRLVFVVPTARFQPPFRRDGAPTLVLLLSTKPGDEEHKVPSAESASASLPVKGDASDGSRPLAYAVVERTRHFEEDVARAPLDRSAAAAGVDTWWYWRLISHQAKSALEIDIGETEDRAAAADLPAVVRLGLLGWSDPRLPKGVPDHRLGVRLGDTMIGEVAWDGRRRWEAEIPLSSWPSPTSALEPDLKLRLKIPARETPDGESIVDLVYVDWAEVRYSVDRPVMNAAAPLLHRPVGGPRRLVARESSDGALALTSSGDVLTPHPEGGWIVPASEEAMELWIAEPSELQSPVAIEPVTSGASDLAPELDYLMLAPGDLLTATERLAEFHRQRGLRVAVVDVAAIYDAYGWGESGPEAVRRFLDHQLQRSPGLRFVLLVGDADWLIVNTVPPYPGVRSAGRGRVPTYVEPSSYGPAPSDHFYAAATGDAAAPRFAVGRLPVADAGELEAVVGKILAYAAAPAGEPRTLLLLSDATAGSLGRRDKLSERVAGAGFALRRPYRGSGPPDEAVIDAFASSPSVVHFGGHGGRFQWQLGESAVGGPGVHFDVEDVKRLPSADRWPVALSISCATAPFDHPSAGSLGEALVLAPGRGVIAFLGAGVRLFTPTAFSDELIRALAREPTVGEAVVAAKRAANSEHVSRLYNLLGDPALPVR